MVGPSKRYSALAAAQQRTAPRLNHDLGNGEQCKLHYFNEQQKGKLVVTKVTVGGDDNFDFNIQGSSLYSANGGQQALTWPQVPTACLRDNFSKWLDLAKRSVLSQGGALNGSTIKARPSRRNTTTTCTFTNFKEEGRQSRGRDEALHSPPRLNNLLSNDPDRCSDAPAT